MQQLIGTEKRNTRGSDSLVDGQYTLVWYAGSRADIGTKVDIDFTQVAGP